MCTQCLYYLFIHPHGKLSNSDKNIWVDVVVGSLVSVAAATAGSVVAVVVFVKPKFSTCSVCCHSYFWKGLKNKKEDGRGSPKSITITLYRHLSKVSGGISKSLSQCRSFLPYHLRHILSQSVISSLLPLSFHQSRQPPCLLNGKSDCKPVLQLFFILKNTKDEAHFNTFVSTSAWSASCMLRP